LSLHPERKVDAATEAALEHVDDGMTVGLGTGRAAEAFVRGLAMRVAQGLSVRGVPTSDLTAALARKLGIPLTTLEDAPRLDITFDGADEVDPKLDVIKGYGGALVREKIVAASSDRFVVLVGPEKRVDVLGARGKLPIEVLPFGEALCQRRLRDLGCEPSLRTGKGGEIAITDNANHILDGALPRDGGHRDRAQWGRGRGPHPLVSWLRAEGRTLAAGWGWADPPVLRASQERKGQPGGSAHARLQGGRRIGRIAARVK